MTDDPKVTNIRVIVEGRGEFTISSKDLETFADDWGEWKYMGVDEWLEERLTGVPAHTRWEEEGQA